MSALGSELQQHAVVPGRTDARRSGLSWGSQRGRTGSFSPALALVLVRKHQKAVDGDRMVCFIWGDLSGGL